MAGLDNDTPQGPDPFSAHQTRTHTETESRILVKNSHLTLLGVLGTTMVIPGHAAAQFEISPRVGVHFDQDARAEWIRPYTVTHLLTNDAWEINSGGNVHLVGLRLGAALHPRVRVETEILHSRNSHSSFLIFNPDVTSSIRSRDSSISVSHLFVSVRLGVSVTPPTFPLHVRVAAGPVWIRRSSSATRLLDRSTSVGWSAGLNLIQRVGPNVGVGADALLHVYGSSYATRQIYPAGEGRRFTHHDLMVMVGLTFAAGKKTGYGWDSGPQLAPRHNP